MLEGTNVLGITMTSTTSEEILSAIRRESPQDASSFHNCNFRVLSQFVSITDVNFKERSFSVFTELSLAPLHPELRQICLNIGPDVVLPNEFPEGATGRVTVNDEDVEYIRNDPLKVLSHKAEQSLQRLSHYMYDELEDCEGELLINVPESCYVLMDEQKVIKIGIDVKVVNPKHGIHFVCSFSNDGTLESGAHMYTYRSSTLSSTRHWLPCMDTSDQLCLWRIEATVSLMFTVVASGELFDTEYTTDLQEKIYHYQLLVPTSAVNIGFAIGSFTPVVHPDMPEITSFALPSLHPLVKHTTSTIDRVFEYFEELLSCRFPFSSYKQVFVYQTPDEVTAYTGLSILSLTLLYHKKILDVVQMTRQYLAYAVAQQFFGCFVTSTCWLDIWLVSSLARSVTSMFVERFFGSSENLFQISKMLNSVSDYETRWGKIVLRPSNADYKQYLHFDPRNPYTCSPLYADAMFKKGHLVMRMLSQRLGKEPFLQVMQKILSVAMQASQLQKEPAHWQHMTVSTESFFRTVSSVTGQELPTFLEQWIHNGGHAKFWVQYAFNRKRNMIELEVKQEPSANRGRQSYVGPLIVVVQELDGSFTHTVQIDSNHSKHDLQCHSKAGRRQKKKKIPLSTGEELEIDLANMDPDSPVLWIRIDPDLLLLRKVSIQQPVYQWEYMLKYERDVLAQLQALDILQRFPSPHARGILIETIETEAFFYRQVLVRCRAAYILAEVVNKLPETWLGPPALMILFKKFFGCKSAPHIPKPNNFVATSANLQLYFLMHAIPQALARLRSSSNGALSEVHHFLIGLIKYNDNTVNRYSDDHYRASLINALAATVVPAENRDITNMSPLSLNTEMKELLAEFTLALNMDTLKPSFGRVIGIAALQAIYHMRLAALTFLIDMVYRYKSPPIVNDVINKLFDLCMNDDEPIVRYYVASQLSLKPPLCIILGAEDDAVWKALSHDIAIKLWAQISDTKTEPRLRGHYIDLWYTIYGSNVPMILKPADQVLEEKPTPRNIHITSIRNGTDDLLNAWSWHGTVIDVDDPDCPSEKLTNEMNDDTLQ
uniref:Transcription initiation factor TFIID subunit 2 n=1 Tax=Setaria digitata TaxID=48799 RepID=A0A915PKF7_9BILA